MSPTKCVFLVFQSRLQLCVESNRRGSKSISLERTYSQPVFVLVIPVLMIMVSFRPRNSKSVKENSLHVIWIYNMNLPYMNMNLKYFSTKHYIRYVFMLILFYQSLLPTNLMKIPNPTICQSVSQYFLHHVSFLKITLLLCNHHFVPLIHCNRE